MKREILFRGKRSKDGVWIYGLLIIVAGRFYIINKDQQTFADLFSFHDAYQVHPETIGQFTGLLDKNGTRIFEGDVVRSENHNPKEFNLEFIEGGFCCTHEGNFMPIDINHFFPSGGCEIKVTGTIHDQP